MKGSFPLEKFRTVRTPFYYYDTALLRQTLDAIKAETGKLENYHVHYAVKANANRKLLRIISAAGFGADCVSGGEIKASLEAGFPAGKIVFAGVGKSDWEINLALDAGIAYFNVESIPELEVIDIAATLKHVEFVGLHFHIGSQILEMGDFVALCNRVNELQARLERRHINVRHINVGGGLGIDYHHPDEAAVPNFGDYFRTYRKHLNLRPDQQLHFELGRSVVGQCGSLITQVLYVKQATYKQFAIVDAGMTDLIRPALYQAFHSIENLSSSERKETYDVVGPICESSDVFVKDMPLPPSSRGDLMAFRSAGAYGEVMASTYNCRHLPQAYIDDEI